MLYRYLADLTVLLHLAFVTFVVVGGLLALRDRRWIWAHLPAAIWGVAIEWGGWVCPLTPLENWLRRRAGGAGYRGGFVEHYFLPVLYPPGLDRTAMFVLGGMVLLINAAIYILVWLRYRQSERS